MEPPLEAITCPVCGRQLGRSGEPPSAAAVDAHVSRCLRQSTHKTVLVNKYSDSSSDSECGEDVGNVAVVEPGGRFNEDGISSETEWSAVSEGDDDIVGLERRHHCDFMDDAVGALDTHDVSTDGLRKRLRSVESVRTERKLAPKRLKTERVRDDIDKADYLKRLKLLDIKNDRHIAEGENDENVSLSEHYETPFGSKITRKTWDRLFEHQRQGCRWLWSLYEDRCGGILADEMGLGKTAQVCVHFEGVAASSLHNGRASSCSPMFLVVCPATVLRHWATEINNWAPRMRACVFHGMNHNFSDVAARGVTEIQSKIRWLSKRRESPHGLVLIVTYEGLRNMRQALITIEWESICVDEGQKIRNAAAEITSVCKLLCSHHRILLSGTPIQNGLVELWSLFDFCYPGKLGTAMTFETDFVEPIKAGCYAGSSQYKIDIAFKTALRLQRIIQPYLLRRRKTDAHVALILPEKKEKVLFCRLSSVQRTMYKSIVNSAAVERAIRFRRPLFGAIATLRKLCNHPVMAHHKGRIKWYDDEEGYPDQPDKTAASQASSPADKSHMFLASDIKWEDSGKLQVLSQILPSWQQEGHKVLLFSQTQSMLNICEVLLKKLGFAYSRLDGSTPVGQRENIIRSFNAKDSDIFVMLLTTRAGGLGISLTGANRVIILDPCWNPQTDIQARERAWRIGQEKEVTVYRLITKGTIEEKIYRRQISKILLSEKILLNARQQRMPFSKTEVKDIFELEDDDVDDGYSCFLGRSQSEEGSVQLDVANDEVAMTDPILNSGSILVHEAVTSVSENLIGLKGETASRNDISEHGNMETSVNSPAFLDQIQTRHERTKISSRLSLKTKTSNDGLSMEQKIEQRLVTSLFNGDKILGVFDYESTMAGSSGSMNMFSGNRFTETMENYKAKSSGDFTGAASQEIFQHFRRLGCGGADGEEFLVSGTADRTRYNDDNGAYNFTPTGIRTGRTMQFIEGAGTCTGLRATPASVVPRLKKMFAPLNARYSTHELLERFRDLDDQYAQLFRELLRTVATFDSSSKLWKKRR